MNSKIIKETENMVKERLKSDVTGHDWWHTDRVRKTARVIAEKERNVNLMIIELAALLHDVIDWKFNEGDIESGVAIIKGLLTSNGLDNDSINKISSIISRLSFKGAAVPEDQLSIEGQIVQDADRLDAMGAIGIARTFAYGGYKNQEIYNPNIDIYFHKSFDEYKNKKTTTVNHFYEKLLLIKDRLNTKTAKLIAQRKHKIMEDFLEQFHKEWKGEELFSI